jgi:SAM-dependent methyltransferase
MRQEAYDKTDELENRYWWYLGRRYIFDKLLERFFHQPAQSSKIVDIGCGTGGNFVMLRKHGKVLGLDIEPRALDFCRSKGLDTVALMKGFYETGLPDKSADLVTMFDVLEHFEDDKKALQEINRILKLSGYVLLSVPAFKFLWSELDDAVHHVRRYRRKDLEAKLAEAGFVTVKSSYIFFFVFPLVFFYRAVGHFQEKRFHPQFSYVELPEVLNKMFVFFSKIESRLLRFLSFPIGSSVIIIGRKVR